MQYTVYKFSFNFLQNFKKLYLKSFYSLGIFLSIEPRKILIFDIEHKNQLPYEAAKPRSKVSWIALLDIFNKSFFWYIINISIACLSCFYTTRAIMTKYRT